MKRWTIVFALVTAIGLLVLYAGYRNATRDPILREAYVEVAAWPQDEPPMRILALSDVHIAGPDMPPERVRRLARSLNQVSPDVVLIAGDLISEKRTATRWYSEEEVAAPFAEFQSRYGTIVAPGNHDHWVSLDRLIESLNQHGITVLRNEAVRVGPLKVGGIDDEYTDHDDISATLTALDRLGEGPELVLSHTPDVVPALPRKVSAVFAGHTHCGQIALPLIGAVSYLSEYGDRFACGRIDDEGQTVFVGAGLGTSILPLRYGAPPDVWIVTLGPPR